MEVTVADAIVAFLAAPYYTTKVRKNLFADDLYEDAVGKFAVDEVDYSVFHEAFEDLALLW